MPMPSAHENFEHVRSLLLRCSERGVAQTAAGATFICPTPKHGPLAYLHFCFAPCGENYLVNIEELFEYRLPEEYAAYMSINNGASLFSGTFSIYGSGGNPSRSLQAEDQAAVSVADACLRYRISNSMDWSAGWRPIGSMTALNRYVLTIHSNGETRIQNDTGRVRKWKSFSHMLVECVAAVDGLFTCDGVRDHTYFELETAILGLTAITPRN